MRVNSPHPCFFEPAGVRFSYKRHTIILSMMVPIAELRMFIDVDHVFSTVGKLYDVLLMSMSGSSRKLHVSPNVPT